MTPWFTLTQSADKKSAEVMDASGTLRYRVARNWNGLRFSFESVRTGAVELQVEPKVWYTITQRIWIPIEERALAYFRTPVASPVGSVKARFWDDTAEIGELVCNPPDFQSLEAALAQELGGGFRGTLSRAKKENAATVLGIQDRVARPAVFTRSSGVALRLHPVPSLRQVRIEQLHSFDPRIALVAGVLVLFGDGLINPSSS